MIKLPAARSGLATTLFERQEPKAELLWLTRRIKHWKSNLFALKGKQAIKSVLEYRGKLSTEDLSEALQKASLALHQQGLNVATTAHLFAIVDEALYRTKGFRFHESQLLGGWHLSLGRLAEMATGEGKTLTACLPSALFAACRIPVHVISVNDYLTERDAEETRPIHELLGLTVGSVTHENTPDEKRLAYSCDIVYVTNKEVAFDYLRDRDNLEAVSPRVAQLGWLKEVDLPLVNHLGVAIVDEADSVLVDEANIPLILTAPTDQRLSETVIQQAIELDSRIPESAWESSDELMEGGIKQTVLKHYIDTIPNADPAWGALALAEELLNQARSARKRYVRDINYMIDEDTLVIVDENTGRPMPDRSLPWGLQQVLEVREGLEPSPDRRTLSKISYQQFFRKYHWLSGMSGTVQEVKHELYSIYALPVQPIPTNKEIQRYCAERKVFRHEDNKLDYTIARAKQLKNAGRAVLIAVSSVNLSEKIHQRLGLDAGLINARTLEQEADSVAIAGQARRITVVTNMAGRGTDIKLSPECKSSGGLHVIIADCLESERLDRQLFGRAGRQGDPGSYDIYHSLDERIIGLLMPDWLLSILRSTLHLSDEALTKVYFPLLKYRRSRLEKLRSKQRIQLLKSEKQRDDLLSFTRRS